MGRPGHEAPFPLFSKGGWVRQLGWQSVVTRVRVGPPGTKEPGKQVASPSSHGRWARDRDDCANSLTCHALPSPLAPVHRPLHLPLPDAALQPVTGSTSRWGFLPCTKYLWGRKLLSLPKCAGALPELRFNFLC